MRKSQGAKKKKYPKFGLETKYSKKKANALIKISTRKNIRLLKGKGANR